MAYEALAAAFRGGDVIYGLDQPRAAARTAIINSGHSQTTTVPKMHLGCIPGTPTTKTNILIQNDLTNAVWDAGKPNEYASKKSIGKTLTDKNRAVAFREFLKGHDRYNVARQGYDTSNMAEARKAWGRTSKAGLEFQTRRGATVHFIMEGLIDTLDQIAGKIGYGAKGNITSAELRWLYRHRNLDEVRDNVRFWLSDRELSHDEVFNDDAWNAYQPTNEYDAWPQENAIRAALALAVTR